MPTYEYFHYLLRQDFLGDTWQWNDIYGKDLQQFFDINDGPYQSDHYATVFVDKADTTNIIIWKITFVSLDTSIDLLNALCEEFSEGDKNLYWHLSNPIDFPFIHFDPLDLEDTELMFF